MKKIVNTSFIYAIAAIVGGVFYREFTKFSGFTGLTTLSVVHTHLFIMGMFFFLLLALFESHFQLTGNKKFKVFYVIYNAGLIVSACTFVWRGILQVLGNPLSSGLNASISGIAGLGHTMLAVGLVLFFLMLKSSVALQPEKKQKGAAVKGHK